MHRHWLVKAYMERLLRELATKLNLYKASNKLIHKPVKPHSVHYSPNNEFNVCSNDLRNNALACIQCEYCLSQRTCPFYSHRRFYSVICGKHSFQQIGPKSQSMQTCLSLISSPLRF